MGCTSIYHHVERRGHSRHWNVGSNHSREPQTSSCCKPSSSSGFDNTEDGLGRKGSSGCIKHLQKDHDCDNLNYHLKFISIKWWIHLHSIGRNIKEHITLPSRNITLSELQWLKRQFVIVHRKVITLETIERGTVD